LKFVKKDWEIYQLNYQKNKKFKGQINKNYQNLKLLLNNWNKNNKIIKWIRMINKTNNNNL